jgi:hypothetical protein
MERNYKVLQPDPILYDYFESRSLEGAVQFHYFEEWELAGCPWCGIRPTVTSERVSSGVTRTGIACMFLGCPVGPVMLRDQVPVQEQVDRWNTYMDRRHEVSGD